LVMTDMSFTELYRMETDVPVSDVQFADQRIFALDDETVLQYTLKGEKVRETAAKTNVKDIVDYNGCIVISGDSLEKLEKASIK